MTARILVIEDNRPNLELMAYLLNAFGYDPLLAEDGLAGLEVALREKPDLILCDIQLPGLDGYEIAGRLKSDPTTLTIPLIAVTALAMVGDRDKVLASGFDGYIAKPIAPESFVEQVEMFLPPSLKLGLRPHADRGPTEQRIDSAPTVIILVVDNSYVNHQLARSILEPFGFEVISANTPKEALALAKQSVPDLILSDMNMPDEDGLDLLRAVKADRMLAHLPFIFLTSTCRDERLQAKAISLGAAKFLLRPIEPKELLAEIRACLPSARR